ncbi:hypothetical protein KGF54_001960 [Candida jiufengensis]|uniref:uncharacterized protein n=1 Tax=Candida jiufengensis TaxID=497108 RepID=UPI0022249961|nr:uncharacterized protein KGF54_001960 [Candida jiufengensis]KAI5954185.1 hypothetical protein KGF54_001960 [Candida jiufengensis]
MQNQNYDLDLHKDPLNVTNLEDLLDQYQQQAKEDDKLLKHYGNQVNNVFKIVRSLHNDEFQDFSNFRTEVPLSSIKLLALQLNKLKILDLKYRNESIDHKIQQLSKRNIKLTKDNKDIENQIDSLRLKLLKKESNLIKNYENELLKLNNNIQDYETVKIQQVITQSHKLQLNQFRILIDSTLQKSDKKLKLGYQPILKIQEFLGYNLLSINQFLERLINFQIQLNSIFRLKLPYLIQLAKYLPDSKFFDLLKRKEMMITGEYQQQQQQKQQHHHHQQQPSPPKQPTSENFYEEPPPQSQDPKPKEISNVTEKIIKLGEEYQLPLSSKTLNYQRRVARSSSVTSIDPAEFNSIPTIRENSSPISTNTKKITIPHKIINKPFNKLSIKDFIEFLVIIVKIIINFQIILKYFQVNTDQYKLEDWCDIELILSEIHNYSNSNLNLRLNSTDSKSSIKTKNFQQVLEQVYSLIIKSSYAEKYHTSNKILNLQNLKFQNLFLNQSNSLKFYDDDEFDEFEINNKDEWDLISEIL